MSKIILFFSTLVLMLGIYSCTTFVASNNLESEKIKSIINSQEKNMEQALDTAIFAAGCFWCVEGQLKHLNGVIAVKSGYIGGTVENPNYEMVCTGTTGHAEAVRVTFDTHKINYDQLLAAFFISHDPTQLNRQGNDIGTQYRSAIFPKNNEQLEKANYYIQKLNDENVYDQPIVTTIEPYTTFYEAEAYHDNYFELNPQNAYCQMVVKPKIEKFKKIFSTQLKD